MSSLSAAAAALRAALSQFPKASPPLVSQLPTPLEPLHRLRTELGGRGPQLWVKREDLTGLTFGGNKTRMLQVSALPLSAWTSVHTG